MSLKGKGAPQENCSSQVTAVGKENAQRVASPRRSGRSSRSPRRFVVTARTLARQVRRVEGKDGGLVRSARLEMMRGVRGLCFALLWILAGWLHAQEDDDFTPPPRPADGILDEARMFARSPERHQAVASALAALQEKHGFPFYYVLYNSLYGRSLDDRAHALQQAWLGESPGIVLVLETDSKQFRVGQGATKQDKVPVQSGAALPVTGPKELAPSDLGTIMRGMEGSLLQAPSTEEYSERLATGMATGISKVLDERVAAPEGTTKSRLVLLAVGFGAAVGLISLLVVAGLKRAEAKALERFVFPKATVGTRLGAPFGGGKVSSRSFRSREGGR
jgi:hypothetical protein